MRGWIIRSDSNNIIKYSSIPARWTRLLPMHPKIATFLCFLKFGEVMLWQKLWTCSFLVQQIYKITHCEIPLKISRSTWFLNMFLCGNKNESSFTAPTCVFVAIYISDIHIMPYDDKRLNLFEKSLVYVLIFESYCL